jgi:EmrB/QacA subfamily drug resistance transporter
LPLAVLVAGMFMSILDISIVNVAIPTIQNEFGANTDDLQWVITGYTLTFGVVVPASAWLGDRFGLSRVYNFALLGFAAGSALCGLAWSLNSLVLFRIVQAIPGGILPAITLSILYRIVPRDRFGAAMGMYGLGIVVAPAVGPTLGGYLVEYGDWRLIFFINAPIGILGAVAAALALPQLPTVAGGRFDVLGFVTIASALFALLLALSEGQSWGWYSYRILILITYSVLSLALFVVIELEVTEPLLDIRIFRYWAYTRSLLLIAIMMVVMFGRLFYIPLLLQQVQGLEPLDVGLTLLPQALVMGVLTPITGRIYDRVGPRWPAVIGLAVMTGGSYLLHAITADTSREHIMWLLTVQGAGLGIALMPVFTSGIASLPATQVNTANAFDNVVQRVAGAFGLAALTAILTSQQAQQMAGRAALMPADTLTPDLGPTAPPGAGLYATYLLTQQQVFVAAIDDLFLILAALSALGALVALLLRSGPAAAPAGFTPPAQAASPSAPANGKAAVERDLRPSATSTAASNGDPARPSNKLIRPRLDTNPPDTPEVS